eukprot:GEZU01038949.1.p1 GENE.GEZU01038949.1~~GEZU01038949.1.p1  ORF type:complete len:216 (+),score=39.49 GEZU01038949.1:195-842(+)
MTMGELLAQIQKEKGYDSEDYKQAFKLKGELEVSQALPLYNTDISKMEKKIKQGAKDPLRMKLKLRIPKESVTFGIIEDSKPKKLVSEYLAINNSPPDVTEAKIEPFAASLSTTVPLTKSVMPKGFWIDEKGMRRVVKSSNFIITLNDNLAPTMDDTIDFRTQLYQYAVQKLWKQPDDLWANFIRFNKEKYPGDNYAENIYEIKHLSCRMPLKAS